MEETKLTFKRHEKKYVLTTEKYNILKNELNSFVVPDAYPESTVCSIYYDSKNYKLIRNSIDKPAYKEKLRIRCYNISEPESEAFVEVKKKYKGIVYKRRIVLKLSEAVNLLNGKTQPAESDSQIKKEILKFIALYEPEPKVMVSCEREAFVARDDQQLRITFDRNLRWRDHDLDFRHGSDGEPVVNNDMVLMEIKTVDTIPLWLAHILSNCSLYPAAFSKYGTIYKRYILENNYNV